MHGNIANMIDADNNADVHVDLTPPFKIFHIISKRFLVGQAPEHATRLRAGLFNSPLYIEEDLSLEEIGLANKCDAVFARHTIRSDLLDLIKVPVFLQHESPLKHISALKDGPVYMTDEAYLDHYPNSEPMPQLILDEPCLDADYEFDVIFVGRGRGWGGLPSKLLGFAIKSHINNFDSIFGLISSGRFWWFFSLLKTTLPRSVYMKLLWHMTNAVRGLRRERIVEELHALDGMGIRVAIIGDSAMRDRFKNCPRIRLFDVSKWDTVKSLISRSIFTVATTPLHQSIMDCRYFEALQCGSIPLVEPYPQYARLAKHDPNLFVFDYKKRPLSRVVKKLLDNLSDSRKAYSDLREAAVLAHGKDKYIADYKLLVRRYTKDRRLNST